MEPHAGYDVVILGGGPAGCATALALRQLGVAGILVAEAGRYNASRVGESMPPDTRTLLQKLGVWEDFQREEHDPCLGSCSSWGDDRLGYNDFLFNPLGNGWHLDRMRFDAFLARETVESGVELRTGTRFEHCAPVGSDGFSVRLAGDDGTTATVRAQFVVDATGMRASFVRRLGAKQRVLDRLICVYGFFELLGSTEFSRLTMLEAVEYGWWYAAKLPNGRLAVAVASDPDLVKRGALHRRDHWLACLQETQHLARQLASSRFIEGSLLVCPALSCLLDYTAGHRWLAVGDAASAYDPIAAQGIYKALSDGVQAAPVIAVCLDGNADGLSAYHSAVATRFNEYVANRNFFYGVETRWAASPFWARRQARRPAGGAADEVRAGH